MFKSVVVVFVASWVLFGAAAAATVSYALTTLGGDSYAVEFFVENSALGAPIEEITIYFPFGEFENLRVTGSPLNWDGIAIEPDLGIPDDGFHDWLALADPLAGGATLGGFTALFTYLGSGAPGGFLFDIVDPVTFAVRESGIAQLIGDGTEIPAPSALLLFLTGFAATALSRKKVRRAFG